MIKPVIEEVPGVIHPHAVFHNLKKYPYSFFLDSSLPSERLGRFSLVGCDPFLIFKSKLGVVTLESRNGSVRSFKANPFLILKELMDKYRTQYFDDRVPMTSGAVGYLSYDMKDYLEKLPDRASDDMELPDCTLGFYDSVIVFDHVKRKTFIAADGSTDSLKLLKDALLSKAAMPAIQGMPQYPPHIISNFSIDSYVKTINKAKRYIKKGDIYQVNLSQRFEAGLNVEPYELYLKLRDLSPAPFSSFLNFGDVSVASSSMERFLLKKGRYIETRPIKGTRPRGKDEPDDIRLASELKNSPKDNAEHIMIVDLERNDLGRICRSGSVAWAERAVVEKYANVSHLVSTVNGTLAEGVGPVDCLMAAFPGGSITGAPKIRSMEIIEELEPVKRSIYTGAIGYISFDGNMDTSIVIRTFVAKGKKVYFSVGGGIVADSDPEKEYAETLDKASALMASLGVRPAAKEAVLT